jgi:predicted enzyme related to lactoylglutathione lyase
MYASVRSITIDCADPYRLARWWCEVFGVEPHPDDFPGDPEALCFLGEGQTRLLFERVPETKSGKNRLHIDVQPAGRRDEEVERVLSLGASLVADHREADGIGWVVLADPDGNEFCIERGLADA